MDKEMKAVGENGVYNFILADMPQKPDRAMPCTGCGICCQLEICEAGAIAFGKAWNDPPCPGLWWEKGRYWCSLVIMEAAAPVEKIMAQGLRIGQGCYVAVNDGSVHG